MGKIKIIGKAKREYQPDQCEINLSLNARERASDISSKQVNDQLESLLAAFVDIGINIENIVITNDRTSPPSELRFQGSDESRKEFLYETARGIQLVVPADQKIINIIRDITEDGFKNISFSRRYILSNEMALRKELLKDAIADSKEQALFFAESMGQRIVGIETANLSSREDFSDPLEYESELEKTMRNLQGCSSQRPLSDKLKANTIELSAEVNIVWMIDSDNKKSGED